jgi:hypothetical protein
MRHKRNTDSKQRRSLHRKYDASLCRRCVPGVCVFRSLLGDCLRHDGRQDGIEPTVYRQYVGGVLCVRLPCLRLRGRCVFGNRVRHDGIANSQQRGSVHRRDVAIVRRAAVRVLLQRPVLGHDLQHQRCEECQQRAVRGQHNAGVRRSSLPGVLFRGSYLLCVRLFDVRLAHGHESAVHGKHDGGLLCARVSCLLVLGRRVHGDQRMWHQWYADGHQRECLHRCNHASVLGAGVRRV